MLCKSDPRIRVVSGSYGIEFPGTVDAECRCSVFAELIVKQ